MTRQIETLTDAVASLTPGEVARLLAKARPNEGWGADNAVRVDRGTAAGIAEARRRFGDKGAR